MTQRAKIDADGVYWGPEDVAKLGPGDIAAPDEAIKAGKYRWQPPVVDGDREVECGHWAPLPPHQHRDDPDVVSLEMAFYELLGHLGVPLTPKLEAWCKGFEKSMDAKGALFTRRPG